VTEEDTGKKSGSKKADAEELRDSDNMDCILVGNKNVMSYVLACVTLFNKGAEEVVIKARGRLISRAVDVSQVYIRPHGEEHRNRYYHCPNGQR
jgi:hypothetical protein